MATMSTVKVSFPCMLTNVPQKQFSSSTRKFPVSLGSVANASRTYGLKTSHSSGAFAVAAYKIKLVGPNGEENEFEAPSDQYILDAAETAGVDLPYSCRAGACSTCAGKIVSGTVDQSDGSFLDDNQLKEGYLLTCVSYPTSDLVIQTYKEADFY